MRPKAIGMFLFGIILYATIGAVLAAVAELLLIPYAIIGFCVVVLLIVKLFNRRRKRLNKVPLDILQDFETAEKVYVNNKGNIEPHEIMWRLNRQRELQMKGGDGDGWKQNASIYSSDTRGDRLFEERERGTEIPPLHRGTVKRQEFQDYSYSGTSNDQDSFSRSKGNNNKRLFRRRR